VSCTCGRPEAEGTGHLEEHCGGHPLREIAQARQRYAERQRQQAFDERVAREKEHQEWLTHGRYEEAEAHVQALRRDFALANELERQRALQYYLQVKDEWKRGYWKVYPRPPESSIPKWEYFRIPGQKRDTIIVRKATGAGSPWPPASSSP